MNNGEVILALMLAIQRLPEYRNYSEGMSDEDKAWVDGYCSCRADAYGRLSFLLGEVETKLRS